MQSYFCAAPKCPRGIGKEAFGVEEESGGCHVRKPVGLHKGIGSAYQATGAFCFFELSIATQGYA